MWPQRSNSAGRLLGAASFAADRSGYQQLLEWLESWGKVARVGVEGAGSCGAGLARRLAAAGVTAVGVNRPNRQMRPTAASDPATAAANTALRLPARRNPRTQRRTHPHLTPRTTQIPQQRP